MKVTVVGAGAVGASCAEYIAIKNFASEVVLVDIKEDFAEGKAMDLMQTAALNGFDTKITGATGDYSKTKGSHVAVITSGIPSDSFTISFFMVKRMLSHMVCILKIYRLYMAGELVIRSLNRVYCFPYPYRPYHCRYTN